ncbi:MAG: Riboflavin biosynthesis protein RibD [Alphaproteobacteria bacterium MarineAlpha9_Bin4]|nr:riboflavin biosynthesis protein RibD [Pelagibacterales bacterium]PPR25953.1 MAG: Riboflavin biosynthesis protein RibD [Alphaproteobacteria bacterium MarineAlpha9_Bin4]
MDSVWLNAAFYQASRVVGNTGKNPPVGCIIVKNNQVIGIGHTSLNGRPHAEENALKMAGNDALGSTMYISLEPCCLDDNLNSCTNQIVKSGVKKVVIGMLDYNKLTLKKGFRRLIKSGVETKLLPLDFENFLFNYSQYAYHVLKRPQITVKLATSADSKITYSNGSSKWITSKLARKHVHQVRSNYDAILVGKNTFMQDDPSLTVRIEGYKKSINRVLLDTSLSLKINSKLLKTLKYNPLIIFTKKKLKSKQSEYLISKGVKIYQVKTLSNGLLCISSVIKILHRLKIRNVLVEGGAITASSFLNSECCDFMYIYKSKTFIGNEGLHAFGKLNEQKKFSLYNELCLKDNKLEIWINNKINKIYKKLV